MAQSSQTPQSETPVVGVRVGDIEGGIHNTTIAGRDVIHRTINVFAGGRDARIPQDRCTMLKQVKYFWIEGVLQRTRAEMGLLDLGLSTRSSAIQCPLRSLAPGTDYPEQQLPRGTKFIDVLDKAGGALLILGEPGAGKTTMLLELASDAIRRAENHDSEPIPVILKLSSWGIRQQAFDEWLVDELNAKYTVPRIIARQWIDNKELLLLLDGLDEVRAEKRDACVQAINSFRLNYYGSMPLVICSRVADYDLLRTKITANAALVIHPLSASQIEEYLTSAGPKLNALQTALSRDPAMMELAHSPLMLNIMSTIYQDLDVPDRSRSHSLEERRDQVLHIYVQSMFERRRPDPRYPQDRTIQRLTWLAQQMSRHSESLLIVERLQPNWLQTDRQRRQYAILSRILTGSVTGGLIGLVFACLTIVILWPVPLALIVWAFVTSVGGIVGLVVGWAHSSRVEAERIGVVEALAWSWQELYVEVRRRWRTALHSLTMPGALSDPPVWSWRAPISLIGALPAGLRGIVVEDKNGLRRGLTQTAACSVLGAFIGVSYGLISGVCLALAQTVLGFLYDLIQSSPGEPVQSSDPISLLLTYLAILAPSIGLMLGVRNGLRLGGFSIMQHLTLRALLWHSGVAPWNLNRFLDHATQLTLMRKVGNGYIFAHGLLQDYFARLAEDTWSSP